MGGSIDECDHILSRQIEDVRVRLHQSEVLSLNLVFVVVRIEVVARLVGDHGIGLRLGLRWPNVDHMVGEEPR